MPSEVYRWRAAAEMSDNLGHKKPGCLGTEQGGDFVHEAPFAQCPCRAGLVPPRFGGKQSHAAHDHTALWPTGR